jgi:hypothetical protein
MAISWKISARKTASSIICGGVGFRTLQLLPQIDVDSSANKLIVKFEILTAVKMIFWVVTQCALVGRYPGVNAV